MSLTLSLQRFLAGLLLLTSPSLARAIETVASRNDAETAAPRAEMRVAIVGIRDGIRDREAIQRRVDEIAALEYNAIAVPARYRGNATYLPNKRNRSYPNAEPRCPAAGSVDVLDEFTARGHAAGLKVFAVVDCYLVTEGREGDSHKNHVVNTHPEWRTWFYNNGRPTIQTTAHEGEGLWIDPAMPAARAYIAGICGDILSNYACDGIVLDRIRYPQTGWNRASKDFGYRPEAVAAFHARYGGVGVPDPSNVNWIAFRQEQITATVREIHAVVAAVAPRAILLAVANGRYSDAHEYCYQNWEDWLNRGEVDGVLLQMYSSDLSTFISRCDENVRAYSGPRLLGAATMAHAPGVDLETQIRTLRGRGFSGVAPNRHVAMGGLGYLDDLARSFAQPARWPEMPWKNEGRAAASGPADPAAGPSTPLVPASTTPPPASDAGLAQVMARFLPCPIGAMPSLADPYPVAAATGPAAPSQRR